MVQNQNTTTTFSIMESDIDIGCDQFGYIPKRGTDPDGWDLAYTRFLCKLGYKVEKWDRMGVVTVSKVADAGGSHEGNNSGTQPTASV